MAFGKIFIVSQDKMPPKEPKPQKMERVEVKPLAKEKGAVHLNALVIAESAIEAADYLCSVYFSMSRQLAGSDVSVYTSEFATISRLTEIKQDLEEGILKPVGREVKRFSPEDGEPLLHCTLTVGQSGNQSLAVDLECEYAAPGAQADKTPDVVFAILNWAEGEAASKRIKNAALHFNCPVVWVICGFEPKAFFWGVEDDQILKNAVRDELKHDLEIACKPGDLIAYTQIYGGLEFVRRESDAVIYRTFRHCREYVPVGGYAGVMAVTAEILKHKDEEHAMQTLRQMLQIRLKECGSWYFVCSTEGGNGL